MKVGALCAGYGGLELGLQLAGFETELMWVAETDPGASKVLDKRFNVPNLGDIKLIENPVKVDVITAGFPCQPVSTAGAGAGVNDERWLIDDVVRVATAADAQWVFLENVRGLLAPSKSEAFGQVLDALSNAGYDAKWSCVRADRSVGACHRRDRWFCVAYTKSGNERWKEQQTLAQTVGQTSELGKCYSSFSNPPSADSTTLGQQGVRSECGLEETERETRQLRIFGSYEPAIKRWEHTLGRIVPSATDEKGVAPRFLEWMMGLPDGWVCDVGLSRTDELKVLGNGVVPQQAAFAYDWLLSLTD